MSFAEELKKVWSEELEQLNTIDPIKQKDEYKVQAERVAHLEKQLTDLEKTNMEIEEKAVCKDIDERIEDDRMKAEEKSQSVRNRIEVAKIIVPVISAFAMGLISMKWEKTDTLTSTAGKSSLRDLLRFK